MKGTGGGRVRGETDAVPAAGAVPAGEAGNGRDAGARPAADSPTLRRLAERFGDDLLETHAFRGDDTAVVPPERLVEICRFLRDEAGLEYDLLVDLTAVDYAERDPRFEVVYHFLSLRHLHRVRIKVRTGGENPCVDSLAAHWGCADWLEREVWDMFGIRFRGHPDLKRILMYDGFEGHPLRRDYPIDRRQPRIGPRN